MFFDQNILPLYIGLPSVKYWVPNFNPGIFVIFYNNSENLNKRQCPSTYFYLKDIGITWPKEHEKISRLAVYCIVLSLLVAKLLAKMCKI